jgi:hypothetical protein
MSIDAEFNALSGGVLIFLLLQHNDSYERLFA